MTGTPAMDDSFGLRPPTQPFPVIRHLSFQLTRLLVRLPLTPNNITAISLVFGLLGAACFAFGTWSWSVLGSVLMTLSYILDNCDGEIARLKSMSSEWGARFDDIVDTLVDSAFFACLGYGTWLATGNKLWLWLGLAATAGAVMDFVVDTILLARAKGQPTARSREEEATNARVPQDKTDWLILVFHELVRTDFCFIVFGLAVFDVTWVLLPLAAIGAQIFWVADLFPRVRGWHT